MSGSPNEAERASLRVFPEPEWTLKPLVTIPDIFEAVQAEEVAFGVVPFENSTNGSVLFTLDCFADRNRLSPDIAVCGEIYLDVHHFLVGRLPPDAEVSKTTSAAPAAAPPAGPLAEDHGSGACTPTASEPHPPKSRAKPLTDISHVRRLYSHPQAWGQCSAFLQTYLKGIEAIDVSSTSRAAELVSQDESGTSAAISSEIAAQLCGVDVLAANIEDRADNTTRFFVIRKVGSGNGETGGSGYALPECLTYGKNRESDIAEGKTKSMVSFIIPHEAPGALADVLDSFRKFKLNLTSLNSRPSLEKPFQYIMFVEFEGHKLKDDDGRVKGALEGVGKSAQTWRWLGSWEDQRA
ncbi:PDT domain-containing protein [Plectosphaerella plurivora]|uniref:prephenate dehydratase n=1 Tax=Plectosphaerella plurivora TaxID=936078 RepID=A0A9P8VIZ8_9PEZI|nr:PDT domain-containing protein [Plectosphaerella plurivora]